MPYSDFKTSVPNPSELPPGLSGLFSATRIAEQLSPFYEPEF